VPAGEAFTPHQALQVREAVVAAEAETGLTFSVYVGRVHGEPRPYAMQLHAALAAQADRGVLVLVEPEARRVEIVTGATARRRLDDRAAGLAGLSMATSFAGGDLAGGITNGLRMMAQAAARPPVLHQHDNL
jgi:uncharacterized membrane protein YgcG